MVNTPQNENSANLARFPASATPTFAGTNSQGIAEGGTNSQATTGAATGSSHLAAITGSKNMNPNQNLGGAMLSNSSDSTGHNNVLFSKLNTLGEEGSESVLSPKSTLLAPANSSNISGTQKRKPLPPPKLRHKDLFEVLLRTLGKEERPDNKGVKPETNEAIKIRKGALKDRYSTESLRRAVEINLATKWLEIIVVLEGDEPITGACVEARNSYSVDDILFDQTFAPCVTQMPEGGAQVDYKFFHKLVSK